MFMLKFHIGLVEIRMQFIISFHRIGVFMFHVDVVYGEIFMVRTFGVSIAFKKSLRKEAYTHVPYFMSRFCYFSVVYGSVSKGIQ